MTRAFNVGRAQPRPAHQRPAFAGRPSLPSLDTLARMNVVLTKKVHPLTSILFVFVYQFGFLGTKGTCWSWFAI
jgi:hypothetical protein